MAVSRIVGRVMLGADWAELSGILADVPFSGGACPASFPFVTFSYTKPDASLSSGEPAMLDAVRAMLQDYLDAEESCTNLRDVRWWQLTLGGSGEVLGVTAWLNGPTVAGRQRQVWARWRKSRTALSSGEPAMLDDAVAMLLAHLESDEPL